MAAVLADVGQFVYHRVATELLGTVDQTLRALAREEGDGGRIDADTGGGATLGQVFGPNGQLRHSQPAALQPLVGREVATKALSGRRVWLDRELPEPKGEWRVLAEASQSGQVAVVARSLGPR